MNNPAPSQGMPAAGPRRQNNVEARASMRDGCGARLSSRRRPLEVVLPPRGGRPIHPSRQGQLGRPDGKVAEQQADDHGTGTCDACGE